MSCVSDAQSLKPSDSQISPPSDSGRTQRMLSAVLEVQSLMTEADFDLDQFMQRVVDLAAHLTHAKGAVVELVDGNEMVYRCASDAMRAHVGLRLPREASLSGRCVAAASALRCDDSELDDRVDQDACRRVGVRSMICAPLFQKGRCVGVLKVMGDRPHQFDGDDQDLLNLLGGTLGAGLGNQLALDELKTSEQTFRAAMESAAIGIALVSPDGRFLKVNAALCEQLGYEESELLGQSFENVTDPQDIALSLELVRQTLAGERQRYSVEKRYRHKSGRVVWGALNSALVRDNLGRPSYFVSQIQDVSERREMDRVKNEFIAMVSHELRTPLTSIRGSLGLILGTQVATLAPKTKGLLDIAQSNCERLIRLINDILDMDKIVSGHMRFEMQPHSLAQVLRLATQSTDVFADRLKIQLQLEAPPERLLVNVDEDRLVQVLCNLLSNAVKFSPPESRVRITVQEGEQSVRVNVIDRGPGIAEEFRARIFQRFSQADSSATRRAGGTGLGLHISREIMERLGGRIGFDTRLGQGTTFWIELPRLFAEEDSPLNAAEASGELPRILHIERDVDLGHVIATALQGHAQSVLATTLAQAEQLLRTQQFAMVILDLRFADGLALELFERWPMLGRSLPVVMLSEDAPPSSIQSRLSAMMVKTRVSEKRMVDTVLRVLSTLTADTVKLPRLGRAS